MLKMINKTLMLFLIGALFPVCTQGMNEEDPYNRDRNQGMGYGDGYGVVLSPKKAGIFDAGSSDSFRATEESEIPPPKSYRALQIPYEYLLYEFCNHKLDAEGSRAKEESRKNKEYFKAALTKQMQRAFSVQPNANLNNQLGYEIEGWLVRRDKECATYKAASTELQKRKGLLEKAKSQRNEIRLRNAQQNFNAIFAQVVWMHAPSEVVRGEREVTEEEIASIKQRVYSKERPPIIITPRSFYSSGLPVGTPYFKDPNVLKIQGFILEPRELKRARRGLKKLVEVLDREHKILQSISVYYNETFLPKVKGWDFWQMKNWGFSLAQIIATDQIDIKNLIEKKYPFPPLPRKYARDWTTDQGEVLAYLNRDERGQKLRVRLSKVDKSFIERSNQDDKMSEVDQFFAKIYQGEDELEPDRTPEGSHVDTKHPHPNPITVQFEGIKKRKYIRNEEEYKIRLMLEPTPDDYPLLQLNELALSLKENQLYCWGKNKDEMRIDTLTAEQVSKLWLLKKIFLSRFPRKIEPSAIFKEFALFYCQHNDINAVLQKDVYERLQKAVQENKELIPKDRRAFLDFLLLKKYIFRTQETWAIPKDIQMVEEYPSLSHVFAHKRKWVEIARELHSKHHPIITDFCRAPSEIANGYTIITSYEDLYSGLSFPLLSQPTYQAQEVVDYNVLCKTYEMLLSDHIKLLREMHQLFGSYTYIPEAIKFFISEAYAEKPSTLPITPLEKITLNDASIRDDDLQKKRLTQNGYEYMLYCYLTVNLSNNFLTGSANYHFSKGITTLNLSGNHINSLKFLSCLSALKILDLSNNMVSDLSDFSKIDQECLFLQELNLSDNEIEDIAPLSALKVLKKLDVSNNKLKNLRGFYQTDMTPSSYDVVLIEEKPQIIPRAISKQLNMSLLTSLKANNNVLDGHWKSVFPEGLNSLSVLEIKGNANLKLPSKPHDFFEIFSALKTLKTDTADEDQMSKEPILIDLRYRSIQDENIGVKDRLLKIGGQGKNITEGTHPLFYCMWVNLSNNNLIGSSLKKNDFSSDCIVKLEISKNMLCSLGFVRGFPNLTYLDASSNHIDDLFPLEACSFLKYLDISVNNVRDLKSLKGFTSLKILKASSNAFDGHWKDILPEGLENLETVEMGNNNAVIFTGWGELRTYFPALKCLNRGENAFVRGDKEEIFKEVSYG